MDELTAFVIVLSVATASLTMLALGYWYIMHQDGTVLTAVSSIVGGLVGYLYKYLREKMKQGGEKSGGGTSD